PGRAGESAARKGFRAERARVRPGKDSGPSGRECGPERIPGRADTFGGACPRKAVGMVPGKAVGMVPGKAVGMAPGKAVGMAPGALRSRDMGASRTGIRP
ncbi:MAG TPA: hypothetical protein PLL20_20580, partial [Phycisphaerae bacterium]|nr:hypothetical protein [Phycisphaerae bacterium]